MRQRARPATSYRPGIKRTVKRSPFGQLFEDDFFGERAPARQISTEDDFFGNGISCFDDDFFGMNRRSVRPRNTAGKENKDPKFDNLPVPQKPAQAETRAAPRFFKEELNSNTLVQNGNATTINKKTVTENDKTETFVTKITEDKEGNKAVTDLAPEAYSNEVKELFENSDMVIQEVPQQIEAETVPAIVDENKMFEEKIKQSSAEKIYSDDNKSAKSGGSSGNELFGDIKF